MPSRLTVTLCLSIVVAAASGCATSGSTTAARVIEPRPAAVRSGRGELAASIAQEQIGVRYRYGGTSPDAGFDCSGLVYYSFTKAGVDVPRTSRDQFRAARKIALVEARPGDIVFFQDQEKLSHVGIYVGAGLFVHAPSSGKTVSMDDIAAPYYQEHLVAVGRLDAL